MLLQFHVTNSKAKERECNTGGWSPKSGQSWALAVTFKFFLMENDVFTFSLKRIGLGVDCFSGPGPEVEYLCSENGLEEAFETKLQNRKPLTPSSAQKPSTGKQMRAFPSGA